MKKFLMMLWKKLTKTNQQTQIQSQSQPKEPSSNHEWIHTNNLGIDIITYSEGFYSKPYLCPAGVPTIGYGTIAYPDGTPVKLSDPSCTKEQAKEWFRYELKEKESALNEWIISEGISLNENQFSALISFAYNLGIGRVIEGPISLALKSGDHGLVTQTMMKYVKARNKFGILIKLRGLEVRRGKEVSLYNKKVVE